MNSRSAVNKLLFPVKLAGLSLLMVLSQSLSCGYRAAYGGPRPGQRLSVEVASSHIAHLEVVDAVMAGAREELSRAGVLDSGQGHPRLVIEVVRVDERPEGISALPLRPGSTELAPAARGTSVGVVGRAWVLESPGSPPVRPTGDVRRVEHYAVAQDPGRDALQFIGAARSAARKLGIALARRVLGEPAPTVEPM